MKILIIGNGFLARPIINRLESEGHNLLVFSRGYKNGVRSNQIFGDIFDFEEFIKVFSWKPEVVIHTAWVTTQGLYAFDASNYQYSRFTSDLARYVAQSEIEHMIVLGSCAEYGPQTQPSIAGITRISPNTIYGEQKAAAFNSVRKILSQTNVRLSWVRVFQPFGPGQDKRRLLPQLVDAITNGRQIVLHNTSTLHDWITTRDIASIISWIIHNNTPIEIDAGTAIGYTNVQVLQHLEVLLGNTHQWRRFEAQPPKNRSVAVVGEVSPIFLSGWRPSDTLDSGLKWILDS